jgi:quinol monooxygenase YgiN
MMRKGLLAGWFAGLMATVTPSGALADADPAGAHPVLELRQYKIVAGQRDAFIALFEREFVESQEALGMRLVGQYRDLDDPNRFVWLREFPDMARRGTALTSFYTGPVWQAHRGEANPMLDDNDNVLLLKPIAGRDFAPASSRAGIGAASPPRGMVVATIYYLWKEPEASFAAFFDTRMRPALEAAGMPVLAAFVPETQPNNFARLPVRQGERVFVWFTRVADQAAYARAQARLYSLPAWRGAVATTLADAEERPAQILRLDPTPRAALR